MKLTSMPQAMMLVPSLIKEVFGNASCIVEPIMLSTSRGHREMEIVGAKEQLRKRMSGFFSGEATCELREWLLRVRRPLARVK